MKDTIGLIGVGNMGTAILEGLFERRISKPSQVWIYDKMQDKAREFSKKWGVHQTSSAGEVARHAQWILLAVKPQDLSSIGAELKPSLTRKHGMISILAGTPAVKIRKAVGTKPAIVRSMPNLGAKVGQSMTAVTGTEKKALQAARTIFDACGRTVILPERFFDLVTAVSGSGPAYFFFLMEVLTDFGVRHGLKRQDAELLAVQTARGAAHLAAGLDVSPKEWRERVTSKKGTTEAAFKVIQRSKVDRVLAKAFQAALDRGRELSRL
ncbi:MAG: pyrroline-5-carboxylate reductase [Candidatus Omnitrophica bacterium]|nr:pyrroline-5-carboxylate reductase [Candidatus Omnitrophota bacterium]